MLLTAVVIFFTASTRHAVAQDDPDDVSLGDLARSLRAKSVAIPETVIDNDNLSQVVDDAETRRDAGLLPVFSLDPGYNTFHVSSPDVTCSLTFTAKNASLSDQFLWSELPSAELSKLDGPAIIDGDTLQVTIRNGTSWELREVVIGLTIIRIRDTNAAASYGSNAKSATISGAAPGPAYNNLFQKEPDTTVLLRMKGSAEPSATAIFRTTLNFALFPGPGMALGHHQSQRDSTATRASQHNRVRDWDRPCAPTGQLAAITFAEAERDCRHRTGNHHARKRRRATAIA